MTALEFDAWWREFLAERRDPSRSDRGENAADDLVRYAGRLSQDLHAEFVASLTRTACTRAEGWRVALRALESLGTPAVWGEVASRASALGSPTRIEDDEALAGFVRVLAASPDAGHRQVVRRYLLESPFGAYWSVVPGALWPRDPELFACSWARFFTEVPAATWQDTAIVQAFFDRPEALVCVREALGGADGAAWRPLRDAVRAQLGATWLSEDARTRLREVCGA